MDPENSKYASNKAKIENILRVKNDFVEMADSLVQHLSTEHNSPLDERADQAYEMIKQKGFFRSYDSTIFGITNKDKRDKLFERLCERHSDVRIKPSRNPKDNRLIRVAYVAKEKVEEYENDPDEKYKELFADYISKKQLAEKLGLDEDDERVQKLISQLVMAKKIDRHPVNSQFRWCGK